MLVEAERKGKLWGGEGDTVGSLTPHPGPLLVERRGRTFHAVGLLWRRRGIARFEQRMRANFLGGAVFCKESEWLKRLKTLNGETVQRCNHFNCFND
jgi:hypothetical protein